MLDRLNLLALIPARGGSKWLPRKNIMYLGGLPLIHWTINAARVSGVCDMVLASTDDEEVAAVARRWKALVPWLRPAELATDTSSPVSAVNHEFNWYESVYGEADAILLMQPASPFRFADY